MFHWLAPQGVTLPHILVPYSGGDLCLRSFTQDDAPAFTIWIRGLLAQQHMPAFLLTFPKMFKIRHARARIRQTHRWARQGRGWSLAIEWQGQLVGQAQIMRSHPLSRRAEVAYWVAGPFQRRGLAQAAVRALIDAAGKEWALEQIEATVIPENQASIRFLDHLGFIYRDLECIPYRVQGAWRRRRAEVCVYAKSLHEQLEQGATK